MDQVSGSRRDHFRHFVSRRWHIDDSSGLGRCYLELSASYGWHQQKHESITLSRSLVWRALNETCNLNSFFPPRWRRPRSRLSPANPRSLYRGVQGILRSLIMMMTAMMMVLIMMADNDTILRADIVHWSWYLTVILRSYCLLNQLTSDHPSTLTKMNIVEAIVSSTVIVINVRWTCGIKANNRVNYVV